MVTQQSLQAVERGSRLSRREKGGGSKYAEGCEPIVQNWQRLNQ